MQRARDENHAAGLSPRHRLQALIRTELAKHNPLEHSRGPLELIAETSVRLAEDGSGEYEVVDEQGKVRTAVRDGEVAKMTVAELVAEFRAKHPTLFKPSGEPAKAAAPKPAAAEPAPAQKRRRGKRQEASEAAPEPIAASEFAGPLAAVRHDPIALPPASIRSAPAASPRQAGPPAAVEHNVESRLAGFLRHTATRLEDARAPLLERLSGLGSIAESKRLKPAAAACLLIGAGFGGSFAFRSLSESRGEERALTTQAQARPLSPPPVRIAARSSTAEVQARPAAPAPAAPVAPPVAAPRAEASVPGPVFRDCAHCPELVKLPGGTFAMGSRQDATEMPVHQVAVRGFAIGRFAVTVGEWKQCVAAKACSYEASGADDTPVRNLSWADAQQYVAWLSKITQKSYRLPTEAEWEYAARGGTTTKYYWGNQFAVRVADCKGCGGPNAAQEPLSVGSFAPNPFGLHDMAGGIEQWVADCWRKDYVGAARDGSARETKDCRERVLRGGSWKNEPAALRSAARTFYDANVRYPTHGLRVARSE